MEIRDKTVMITGGTSGIGLKMAEVFLREGMRVMVCSQNKASLDAVKQQYAAIDTYTCDLSDLAEVRGLINHVGMDVDIWVNNGGIFQSFEFLAPDKSFDSLHAELEINFAAAALAMTELIKYFRAKQASAIVNVTAGMIYVPLIKNPMYNASESALHSFTVSARAQLKGTGIRIIEIIPPMVATKLTDGMKGKRVSTSVIAMAVVDALKRDRDTVRVGQARSLYLMSRLFPHLMLRLMNNGQ